MISRMQQSVLRATRMAFFLGGFAFAAWAALVPFARGHVDVNDGALGMLLLCLGGGSVVAMPLAGAAVTRIGCRAVIGAGVCLAAVILPFLASTTSPVLLAAFLLLFGAGAGTVDTAMNVQGIIVEKASGRPLMSGLHGMFSVGGFAGAGGMAILFSAGLSPLAASLVVAAVSVLLLVAVGRGLSAERGGGADDPPFSVPRGFIWALGAICCATFLVEGAILDWGGIYLTSVRHVPASQSGWGYAVFAGAMTICRLSGDRIVAYLGAQRVVLLGGLTAMTGLVAMVLVTSPYVALAGYALVGVGCANIVPVVYSVVGRQDVMPRTVAVSAVTTMGYAGILVGPALIGFVSHLSGLQSAFIGLAFLMMMVASAGNVVVRR